MAPSTLQLVQLGVFVAQVGQENGRVEWSPCDRLHQLIPTGVQGSNPVDALVQPGLGDYKQHMGGSFGWVAGLKEKGQQALAGVLKGQSL